MLKYQNIETFLQKKNAPKWSEEGFVIAKVKNTVPRTCVISHLNSKEIHGTFYKKELQKTNQKGLRDEKVLKRKCNKIHFKR